LIAGPRKRLQLRIIRLGKFQSEVWHILLEADIAVVRNNRFRDGGAPKGLSSETISKAMPGLPTSACVVCEKPVNLRCFYCLRCKAIIGNRVDRLLFRVALHDSHDRTIDRFRCAISGAVLEETGPYGPYYITANHVYPGRREIVITGRLFNDMQNALTLDEFLTVVPALDDTLRGIAPFDRNIIRFVAWDQRPAAARLSAPLPLAAWERTPKPVPGCVICGHPPYPKSQYCASCRHFIYCRDEFFARVLALKASWDPVLQAFICRYTGLPLNISDPKSPWYLAFDHLVPGQKGNIAACAFWVNAMKTYLTEAQFRAVIHSLAEHLRRGTEFDRSLVDARMYAMTVRKLGGVKPVGHRF
jgi:hypothetical protein